MTNATSKTRLCRRRRLLLLVTLCAVAAPALAQDLEQPERDQGVSNVAAVMGHGGLTAGFSPEGELTLLRWPSPGYMDQLEYETAKSADARTLPRLGARDNAGAFVGLYTEPGGLTWLRDAGWTRTMMYRADESLVLITTYRNNSLGITVTGTDAVAPSGGTGAHDVLARRFDVEVDQNRTYTVLRLVAFANFAPAIAPVPGAPEAEVSGDAERDYACLYSERARALVSFLPGDEAGVGIAALGSAPGAATVDAFLTGLASNAASRGTWMMMGGDRTPLGFQCGYDKNFAPMAGLPSGLDAQLDAADGTLSGALLAREHADGALVWDLDLATEATVTLYFVFGSTHAEAEALLGPARSAGVLTPLTGIAELSDLRTAELVTPQTRLPVEVLASTALRSLMTIYVARDAQSGAIASSLAAQPAYAVDRPALGAFINLALDAAGHPDWVEAHNQFYVRAQRQGTTGTVSDSKLEGSWAGATFLDSLPPSGGANIKPPTRAGVDDGFAMDATGLALWTLCEHAKWIGGADAVITTRQRTYLESVYPAIRSAANLLTSCTDSKSALQCPAYEGDGVDKRQTLRGGAAAWTGLYAASRIAAVLGHSGEARRWQSRMFSLRQQMDRPPPSGYLKTEGGYDGDQTARSLAIWPAALHPIDDTRTSATAVALTALVAPLYDAHMTAESPARALLALGIYEFRGNSKEPANRVRLRDWMMRLSDGMGTPSTHHFGEVVAAVGTDAYQPRVGTPSASEAALIYLATLSVREGESVLIQPDVRLSTSTDSGFQCQFRVAGGRAHGVGGVLLLAFALAVTLAVALRVRRRGRGRRPE